MNRFLAFLGIKIDERIKSHTKKEIVIKDRKGYINYKSTRDTNKINTHYILNKG